MGTDRFEKLWRNRKDQGDERVRISSAPSFQLVLQWLEEQNEEPSPETVEPDAATFHGWELRADGEDQKNPLGRYEGHRLVRAINAARSMPGQHTTTYVVRSPTYDLGEFDDSLTQLSVQSGDWFPYLDSTLEDALGGGITRYWNRWEHHFRIHERTAHVIYWFNEFLWPHDALLVEDRDVDLVVTGSDADLAVVGPVLGDLAQRCRAEKVPAPSTSALDSWTFWGSREVATTLLQGESRTWTSYWQNRNDPATEVQISEAEATRGIRLPEPLRTMLLESNGGLLRGQFGDDNYVNQHATSMRRFAGIFHLPWFYDGQMAPDNWKPTRPISLLIPFTGDGHADVCLDYRKRGRHGEPQITVVDTERQSTRVVAESFAAYVDMLVDERCILPAAPGVTFEKLVAQLRADFGEITVDERSSGPRWVRAGNDLICQLIPNEALLEYGDCEILVQPQESDIAELIIVSLKRAGLLEGSMPRPTWR